MLDKAKRQVKKIVCSSCGKYDMKVKWNKPTNNDPITFRIVCSNCGWQDHMILDILDFEKDVAKNPNNYPCRFCATVGNPVPVVIHIRLAESDSDEEYGYTFCPKCFNSKLNECHYYTVEDAKSKEIWRIQEESVPRTRIQELEELDDDDTLIVATPRSTFRTRNIASSPPIIVDYLSGVGGVNTDDLREAISNINTDALREAINGATSSRDPADS